MSDDSIEILYQRLKADSEAGGYHLNPDVGFVKTLLESLIFNEERYGYQSCPCRLASGIKEEDIDIICPCDYRDSDLSEFGACYCALYVSSEIADGEKEAESIPDRRPAVEEKDLQQSGSPESYLPFPVWRCKVCGYLCARDDPPETCPVCKAQKDRFEIFM